MKLSGYGSSVMGSCTNIGIFMDFWLTRYDEDDEKIGKILTSYKAKEIGGDTIFHENKLDLLIGLIIKYEYINNNFYEQFIDNQYKDYQRFTKKR